MYVLTDGMARLTILAAHLLLALCGPGKGGAGDSITTYSLVFLQACMCADASGIYKRVFVTMCADPSVFDL